VYGTLCVPPSKTNRFLLATAVISISLPESVANTRVGSKFTETVLYFHFKIALGLSLFSSVPAT